MISAERRAKLEAILVDTDLDRIFRDRDDLLGRLAEFERSYQEKMRDRPNSGLPKRVTTNDIVDEYERNSYRVNALLQAVAFHCSAEVLTGIWLVLLGADIDRLSYVYEAATDERAGSCRLELSVTLRDGNPPLPPIISVEPWDTAILRLLNISKANEQPRLSGFFPLFIPRRT